MTQTFDTHFNPNNDAFVRDPWPTYHYLQTHHPIYFHTELQGWLVTRYDDVMQLIRDDRLSTSYYDWEWAPQRPEDSDRSEFDTLMSHATFQLGTEDHQRIRKLVSPAFAPRVQAAIEQRLMKLANELFDRIPADKPFDYVHYISRQMPAKAIARIIGIPIVDEAAFEDFVYAMSSGINPLLDAEARAKASEGISLGLKLLRNLIAERRKALKDDDFLSQLIIAEEAGEKLSLWELLALISALITAGSETAGQLHTQLIWCLHRNPEQRQLLESQPKLIQNAITETLRYDFFKSPGQIRYAKEDIEYREITFKKGQMIILSLGAAHRDPDVFPDPDQFLIGRDQSNTHVFSLGPHYCMGATIARAQAEVIWHTLRQRFPNYQVVGEPEYDVTQGKSAVRLMMDPMLSKH